MAEENTQDAPIEEVEVAPVEVTPKKVKKPAVVRNISNAAPNKSPNAGNAAPNKAVL